MFRALCLVLRATIAYTDKKEYGEPSLEKKLKEVRNMGKWWRLVNGINSKKNVNKGHFDCLHRLLTLVVKYKYEMNAVSCQMADNNLGILLGKVVLFDLV